MAQKRIEYYGRFTPAGVDTSQAKRLQALSGLAEQVGDVAFGVASGIAERRGLEAGLKAGQQAAESSRRRKAFCRRYLYLIRHIIMHCQRHMLLALITMHERTLTDC
jgi:hypothetical protein